MAIIQAGSFKFKPTRAEIGVVDSKPTIAIKFQLVEGPDTGREIVWKQELEGEYLRSTVNSLRALGYRSNDIKLAPSEVMAAKATIDGDIRHITSKKDGSVYAMLMLGNGMPKLSDMARDEIDRVNRAMAALNASTDNSDIPF